MRALVPAASRRGATEEVVVAVPCGSSRAGRGDPARSLARKMDADPVETPELVVATGALGHRRFRGKLEHETFTGCRDWPSRSCAASRATSATGRPSGTGPPPSPTSSPRRWNGARQLGRRLRRPLSGVWRPAP